MAKRKTISVDFIRDKVNHFLLHSPDHQIGRRIGNFALLNDVLYESGNYKGYRYLTPRDMERSNRGISFGVDQSRPEEDWFKGSDETRRYYF